MRRALLLLGILVIVPAVSAEERRPSLLPPIAITGVAPLTATPEGGSSVAISGHGFLPPPVRVFFELAGVPIEAVVVSISPTRIELITPPVVFGPGEQMRVATVAVEARGYRATARDAFVFENLVAEPKIATVSPGSGSMSGGMLVTISGEGFQAPVQVLFGDAEARVFHVARTQVVAESPAVTGLRTVDVTVRNIVSATEHTLPGAFRYILEPALFSVAPDRGRAGTDITITGEGFIAPLSVTVAGVPALVLQVSPTKIVARAQPPATCDALAGPVRVVTIENGGLATGIDFTYDAEPVEIAAVKPRVSVPGRTIVVQMEREGDYAFTIGGVPAEIVDRNGSTYRVRIPATLRFPTGACMLRGIEGTGPIESRFDLRVVDRSRSCETTRRSALGIAPEAPVPCRLPPLATVLSRTCSSRAVTFANERGRADLVIAAPESVSPRTAVIRGGETKQLTLPATVQLERLRFETNDPRHPWLLVCVAP